jgi:hypothetical protein
MKAAGGKKDETPRYLVPSIEGVKSVYMIWVYVIQYYF